MAYAEFAALLTTPVSVVERTRNPQTGDLSIVATTPDVPSHVEYAPRVVLGRDGSQLQADATAFLLPSAPITSADGFEIVLPDGDVLYVVAVEEVRDPRSGSVHHLEVACGSRLQGQERTKLR